MTVVKIETLTSAANPLLRDVRRAISRGTLTREGYCVAETFHLLEEALRSACRVSAVLAAESVRAEVERRVGRRAGLRLFVLPEALFRGLSATEAAQGVMALVEPPQWSLEDLFGGRPLVVVLDALQDPGNAGTILRAAEAFGSSGVMFLKGTVSPFNPKAVRASAGSVFRLPLLAGLDGAAARAALEERGLDVYAALPSGARSLGEADFRRPCALIIGSEGRGVSDQLRAGGIGLRIPTAGVESLNAALAAGILLYEARRQRMFE